MSVLEYSRGQQIEDVLIGSTTANRVQVGGYGRLGVSEHGLDTQDCVHIQLLPWSDYVAKPTVMARHEIMSRHLGKLIALDTPGVGPWSSELSPGLRRDISRGNLNGVSEIQWDALDSVYDLSDGKGLSVMGYSMGTVLAASFIRNKPDNVSIKRATLVEPVADVPLHVAMLGAHLVQDYITRLDYQQNPEWYKGVNRPLPTRISDLYLYALMLARGKQFDDIDQFADIPTMVISGGKSTVSPFDAVAALAVRLEAEHVIASGETHSMIESIGHMAWLSRLVGGTDTIDS